MEKHTENKENGLAVASLVLGIISVTGGSILTGIPAIVTGAMSLKNPENKGMGIAGIIMGAVSIFFFILIAIFFFLLLVMGAFAASEQDIPNTTKPESSASSLQRI